jgi:hypothetical protein
MFKEKEMFENIESNHRQWEGRGAKMPQSNHLIGQHC